MPTAKKPNRLIKEKSPYLLQHAYNPVNWFPWSKEAFKKAKIEDKPIFLSIGYSTCHWCHVMERESFEDEEVANILNNNFVCIKVDREERPDIDHIYMQVCQMLTGHGGWPLSVFITPEQKPFYAGTYFSKKSMYGRIGFVELLHSIREVWEKDRGRVIDTTDTLMRVIVESVKISSKEELSINVIDSAIEQYQTNFDETYGGFGRAPKFPTPHHLLLLLRLYHVRKDSVLLEMVEKTLESMYKGGIYDHIGFGFSRYSTDEKWLVPHFEKMLYDNALLATAYLEAYQVTEKILYKKAAEEIFNYVLRDMTSPEGGFYSAEDADSEGVEGKFYVWSKDEILKVLGDQGEEFCKIYDISESGNFEGQNIPNLINNHLENKISPEMIQKLFLYRESRVHPHKDDKILTAWNGLMIAALSYGARVLQNEEYRQAAEKAVEFIFKKLITEDGRVLARYREGEAAYLGYAEDYAFLIWGLIELYQTTYDVQILQKAILLQEKVIELFYDHSEGGLFLYGKDGENLITRPKEIYDGAIPSGNSIMTWNWIRLARITSNEALIKYARDTFSIFNKDIQAYPIGYSAMLIGLLLDHESSQEIVVVGENTEEETQRMLSLIQQSYRPFTTVILLNESQKQELIKINADLESYNKINDKTTIYMCENFVCRNPTTSVEELKHWL